MSFNKQKSDQIAQDLLKYKFEKAGRGPDKLDCLGVIIFYFKEFGIEIPDYSAIKDWGEYDEEYVKAIPKILRKLEPDEKLERGDVIVFRNTQELTGNLNHAGIFLGKSEFIHAGVKIGITINKIYQKPWKDRIYGYFRVRESEK
jgi:cell wall-associated NlpC family hydrolase